MYIDPLTPKEKSTSSKVSKIIELFDKDDNFSVSFYMEPRTLFHTPPDDGIVNIDVKYKLQGGYIFNITDD